jgi:hypothetical protein
MTRATRRRLADLEAGYTREKARVDFMQAELFRCLREQYQKRDRLRLIVDHRTRYLDLLLRGGDAQGLRRMRTFGWPVLARPAYLGPVPRTGRVIAVTLRERQRSAGVPPARSSRNGCATLPPLTISRRAIIGIPPSQKGNSA